MAYQWEELPGIRDQFPILARRRIPSWYERHARSVCTAALRSCGCRRVERLRRQNTGDVCGKDNLTAEKLHFGARRRHGCHKAIPMTSTISRCRPASESESEDLPHMVLVQWGGNKVQTLKNASSLITSLSILIKHP